MKYILVVFVIVFTSCTSKKHLSYQDTVTDNSEVITKSTSEEVSGNVAGITITVIDSTETITEVTETDYVIVKDSVSGTTTSVIGKVKVSRQTITNSRNSKSDSIMGEVYAIVTETSGEDTKDIKSSVKLVEDKLLKFSIPWYIYLALALIVAIVYRIYVHNKVKYIYNLFKMFK